MDKQYFVLKEMSGKRFSYEEVVKGEWVSLRDAEDWAEVNCRGDEVISYSVVRVMRRVSQVRGEMPASSWVSDDEVVAGVAAFKDAEGNVVAVMGSNEALEKAGLLEEGQDETLRIDAERLADVVVGGAMASTVKSSEKVYVVELEFEITDDDAGEIVPVPVSSSNLAAVGYDEGTRVMVVKFLNGDVYKYLDVDASVHLNLMEAESVGKFFNENVKGKYNYFGFDADGEPKFK